MLNCELGMVNDEYQKQRNNSKFIIYYSKLLHHQLCSCAAFAGNDFEEVNPGLQI